MQGMNHKVRRIGLVFLILCIGTSTITRAQNPELVSATHDEILRAVNQNEAQVTVLNFWATWCVPCVEEFPYFVKLGNTFDDRGVEVVFVSTDFPEEKAAAQTFLAEHGVTGTSYLKKGKTTPFVNAFSEEWSGAVPATFIYDAEGNLVDFWEGKTDYETLKERVLAVLNHTAN